MPEDITKKHIKKQKSATLYRMVMGGHICPYGLKALDLLKKKNYQIEDVHLTTRHEIDSFKAKHKIKTTPQIFIDDNRIGGYDDLRSYLGEKISDEKVTYKPIIAIFSVAILMSISTNYAITGSLGVIKIIELFVAFSMCILAIQKLCDLESFSLQFLNYDLLAQRWVKYAYIYPFAEAFVGIGMISMRLVPILATIALFIGSIGAISVLKAVYIDKRIIKCACVGGNSKVPLGFVSLIENLMMIVIGIWMFVCIQASG